VGPYITSRFTFTWISYAIILVGHRNGKQHGLLPKVHIMSNYVNVHVLWLLCVLFSRRAMYVSWSTLTCEINNTCLLLLIIHQPPYLKWTVWFIKTIIPSNDGWFDWFDYACFFQRMKFFWVSGKHVGIHKVQHSSEVFVHSGTYSQDCLYNSECWVVSNPT
jgi:hypothetical protein